MLNLELSRALAAEREREIDQAARRRLLLPAGASPASPDRTGSYASAGRRDPCAGPTDVRAIGQAG